jgi:hypothetical protein
MACLPPSITQTQTCTYQVRPPRVWSRVQSSCSFEPLSDNNNVLNANTAAVDTNMLEKGNVLQYKANSSRLTSKQRYSKIATGKWTNRNTGWATQNTRGYTNPNIQQLMRSGNTFNIELPDGTPTFLPVTCPDPEPPLVDEELPPQSIPYDPFVTELPPVIPPLNAGTMLPPSNAIIPPLPVVIQDGGSLLCNVQQNICTGEIISQPANTPCHPTTDSNVPGRIQLLCWNDGTQTWFPRQRRIMTNSGNKFPYNYKFLVSAIECHSN